LRRKTTSRRGGRTVDDTVTVIVPSVADFGYRFDGADARSPATFRANFDPASALSFVAPTRALTLRAVRASRVGCHRGIDPCVVSSASIWEWKEAAVRKNAPGFIVAFDGPIRTAA
jgi:hypothetical protein